ncbi:hypothetical protein LRP52_50095, partial [Photobacterium sp. ZSDE20]|nr:hypothetical protein [Photobacterium sp. ZSDE20]
VFDKLSSIAVISWGLVATAIRCFILTACTVLCDFLFVTLKLKACRINGKLLYCISHFVLIDISTRFALHPLIAFHQLKRSGNQDELALGCITSRRLFFTRLICPGY